MKRITLYLFVFIIGSYLTFAQDNSLEKVKNDGFFIVGLDDKFPPFVFSDENGKIVGFDVDLAKEVAKRLEVEVRFKLRDWDEIIFELRTRKIDMVWNSMSITTERERQVSFLVYHNEDQYLFVKKEADFEKESDLEDEILENEIVEVESEKIFDLEDKIVGVKLGSAVSIAMEENSFFSKLEELKIYPNTILAVDDLQNDEIDAVVTGLSVGNYYNSQEELLKAIGEVIFTESYGIAFRREDISFREAVDEILEEMRADGTFQEIEDRWLKIDDEELVQEIDEETSDEILEESEEEGDNSLEELLGESLEESQEESAE